MPTRPIAPTATDPAILARLCTAAGHSADPYLDRLCVRRHQDRALCRDRSGRRHRGSTAPASWPASRRCCGPARKAIILRTAWVYAAIGKNFVRTMLTVGKTRDRLTVVADQHGCPTTAADLAEAIMAIIAGWMRRDGDRTIRVFSMRPVPARRRGSAWPSRRSRKPPGMARTCPRSRRSAPPIGRRRRNGRRIPGWTARGWIRCSVCACRPGATACRARCEDFCHRAAVNAACLIPNPG